GPLAAVEYLFQLRAVSDDPPVDGGVIHLNPTFPHEFFHMPCAQPVGDIPAGPCQNNILWKMGPLKTHGPRRPRFVSTLSHRGRSYLKWPQIKIATESDHPLQPWSLAVARFTRYAHRGALPRRHTADISTAAGLPGSG